MVTIKPHINTADKQGQKMKIIPLSLAVLMMMSFSNAYSQDVYQVENGDQLWNIAAKFKPENATVNQEMLAIYENNPDAFQYANMNSLRSNVDIKIPNNETVLAISKERASNLLESHYNEWRQGVRTQSSSTDTQNTPKGTLDKQLKDLNTEITAVQQEIKDALNDITVSRNVLEQSL